MPPRKNQPSGPTPVEAFRHELLLYDGVVAFLAEAIPFIQAGLAADEAVPASWPVARL